MRWVVAATAGYLLGSVPVAVLVARARRAPDPRTVGDRNPGYWNVRATAGRGAGVPVFAGDVAKGVLAGLVGVGLAGDAWGVAYVAVGAAMVGHAFPLFAGFRGGRSILTFAGGMAVLAPAAAALAIGACVAVSLLARSFAWGARVGVFGFPVLQLLLEARARVAATGALMSIIGLRFAMAAAAERRLRSDPSGGPDQPSGSE
jgi:acyl phosphate:glycerol-3-phosphate acyltransferase